MHGIDTQQADGRHGDRHDDQQHEQRIEETAQDQKHHVDEQQESETRNMEGLNPGSDLVGNLLRRHDIIDQQGPGDDQRDNGRRARRPDEQVDEPLERQRTIDAAGEQQRIGGSNSGCFGRRDDARINAAEQDHRQHQRGQGILHDPGHLAHRHRRLDRQIVAPGDEDDHHHQRDTHEHAGQESAEKQVSHRGIRHHGVEHHGDGGRDDRADGGGGRGERAGEAGLVAAFLQHHLDHKLAGTGGIRNGATAHAREDHAGDDGDMGESAANAPHDQASEFQQPFADRAGIHDLGGQDE